MCDGCGEENQGTQASVLVSDSGDDETKTNYKHGSVSQESTMNYRLHLKLLREKIDNQDEPFTASINGSIKLLELPYRHGSAKAIAAAFDILSIDTTYVMIAQHDNFFVQDVKYLQRVLQYMDLEDSKSWLQCVHFPSTATLNYTQKVQKRYNLNLEKFCITSHDPPLLHGEFIPLVFWYGRTHIARTRYYTEKILAEYPINVGDHLEEIWGTKQLNEIMELKRSIEVDQFNAAFSELHAKHGNYVFFENDSDSGQTEVLYHMSGRKVRAVCTSSLSEKKNPTDAINSSSTNNYPEKGTFNPKKNSFTTARRAMAVVPGLEFIPPETDKGDKTMKNNGQKKSKRFRQNCFHCGEKGMCTCDEYSCLIHQEMNAQKLLCNTLTYDFVLL